MPRPKSKKTNRVDEQLMIALACGATQEAAATKAGMSPRTVTRRLADPEFRRRLLAFRTDMLERSGAMLTAATMEAVRTLLALMDRTTPHATRMNAARSVIELAIKMRGLNEVEQRLAALEQHVHLPGQVAVFAGSNTKSIAGE